MEPDDVVIADIEGQALDIFLHGPESAHKNGILKTFTHTSIPMQPRTLKKTNKKQLTKHDAFVELSKVVVGDGQEAWQLLLSTAPRPRPPRTVLTENICRCVEQILEPCLGTILECVYLCVCVCACVRGSVRACVRACVCACIRMCECMCE